MNSMKKLVPLVGLTMVVVLSSCAGMPEQSNKAGSDKPIYWIGTDGKFVRDSYGSCVRTIEWKKDSALAECEPGMAKKAKPVEPVAAVPVPAPAPAVKPAPKPQPVVEKVTLKAGALFDVNKADLKAGGKAELDAMVKKIKDNNTQVEQITVTGHTDSSGSNQLNQNLSERRAEAVKTYLVQQGVEPSRVVTQGKGGAQPVASNNTAAGRAQNRRVEIDIEAQRTTSNN